MPIKRTMAFIDNQGLDDDQLGEVAALTLNLTSMGLNTWESFWQTLEEPQKEEIINRVLAEIDKEEDINQEDD